MGTFLGEPLTGLGCVWYRWTICGGLLFFKFVISIAILVYQGVPGIVNPGFLNCFKPQSFFGGLDGAAVLSSV